MKLVQGGVQIHARQALVAQAMGEFFTVKCADTGKKVPGKRRRRAATAKDVCSCYSKLKGWWTHLQCHWDHKEPKTKKPTAVEALLSFGYVSCQHCKQLVPKGNLQKHQRKETCRFEQRNAADPDDPEGIRKSSRDLVGPLRGKLPPLIVVATFQVVTVKTIPESLRIPLGT